MCSNRLDRPEAVFTALERLEAEVDSFGELSFDALSELDCVEVCERLNRVGRKLPAAQCELINHVAERAVASDIGGPLAQVLADRLSIRPGAAERLIRDAGQLAHRRAMTGERLDPLWPTVAEKMRAGVIGADHVAVIRRFFRQLPGFVGFAERERAEQMLGALAADLRPDQLHKAAERMAALINPDGVFSDEDRARKRGFRWGVQGLDGMTKGILIADPQLRATVDAVIAKFGAPGMCNPEDTSPIVDGEPPGESVRADTRTRAQRAHDALLAMARAMLASGQLGQHRGLPASIIVRTTLQELLSGAGRAETGGGSWLPMAEVIKQASAAYHYLAVFDGHSNRPLYLGRTRIASPDQRIVLHARDGGCTAPGCDRPAYECEVMHLRAHVRDGLTEPDNLALGCHTHHKLHDEGFSARLNDDGIVEWLAPPHLNRKPGINNFFHPERYLPDDEDDP